MSRATGIGQRFSAEFFADAQKSGKTVTMIPPGSTVSCPTAMSRSLGVMVTVALAPAASVPDDGTTLSEPVRP